METSNFQTFAQNLQRPINCLTDSDRYIRKQGLQAIHKNISKAPAEYKVKIFQSTNIGKNLIHTLSDPIQNNRQITLNILDVILKGSQLHRDFIDPIVQSLINRINATPYPEKSQDLREKIIELFKDGCMRFKDSVTPFIGELSVALGKCLSDPSSIIKNLTCDLIIEVCVSMRQIIGKYSQNIVKGLAQNLKHNKYQVRKKTLLTISRLMITSQAGSHLEILQLGIKSALSDAKGQVRKAALQCVSYILNYIAPKYLKQWQAQLVSYLLIGLNDQVPQISQKCKGLLQECGKKIKEMQGDDIDEQKIES